MTAAVYLTLSMLSEAGKPWASLSCIAFISMGGLECILHLLAIDYKTGTASIHKRV